MLISTRKIYRTFINKHLNKDWRCLEHDLWIIDSQLPRCVLPHRVQKTCRGYKACMLLPTCNLSYRYIKRTTFRNRKNVISSLTLIIGLKVANSQLTLLVVSPAKYFRRYDYLTLSIAVLRPSRLLIDFLIDRGIFEILILRKIIL